MTQGFPLPDASYQRRPKTTQIAIHCSETTATENADVDIIRTWHTDPAPHGRGWKDIGYHFVITRDGTVQPGRPIWSVPAAVLDENNHIVAVCLVGGCDTHDKEENNFTPLQWNALSVLVTALINAFPDVRANPQPVLGHRDYASGKAEGKFCPSFDVRTWLVSQLPVQ